MLADYLLHLHEVERKAPCTIAAVPAAANFSARKLGLPLPVGEETKEALRFIKREGAGRGRGKAPGLAHHEVERLIASCEQSGTLLGVRDAGIIANTYYAGLRIGEAAALRMSDLNFAADGRASVRVRRSKTDQAGVGTTLALPRPGAKRVRAWLKLAMITEGPLFPSLYKVGFDGPPEPSGRLITRRHAGWIVKERAQAIGMRKVTAHSLRRSFAQTLTAAGLSLQRVARAGRWRDTSMVLRYIENQTASQSDVHALFEDAEDRIRLAG